MQNSAYKNASLLDFDKYIVYNKFKLPKVFDEQNRTLLMEYFLETLIINRV